jgi:hypothetical protein
MQFFEATVLIFGGDSVTIAHTKKQKRNFVMNSMDLEKLVESALPRNASSQHDI